MMMMKGPDQEEQECTSEAWVAKSRKRIWKGNLKNSENLIMFGLHLTPQDLPLLNFQAKRMPKRRVII